MLQFVVLELCSDILLVPLNALKVVMIMTVNGITCAANESKIVRLNLNMFQTVDFDTFAFETSTGTNFGMIAMLSRHDDTRLISQLRSSSCPWCHVRHKKP